MHPRQRRPASPSVGSRVEGGVGEHGNVPGIEHGVHEDGNEKRPGLLIGDGKTKTEQKELGRAAHMKMNDRKNGGGKGGGEPTVGPALDHTVQKSTKKE